MNCACPRSLLPAIVVMQARWPSPTESRSSFLRRESGVVRHGLMGCAFHSPEVGSLGILCTSCVV